MNEIKQTKKAKYMIITKETQKTSKHRVMQRHAKK